MEIHLQVAQESKMQWSLATVYNSGSMDLSEAHPGSFDAILLMDTVDIKETNGYFPSHYCCLQWHVRLYAWSYASFR